MAETSEFVKSLKSPFQWIALGLILVCLAAISLVPGNPPGRLVPQVNAMQVSRTIGLAMFAYAQDNKGAYPTGKSSTEVFQKLLDSGYISDPAILYTRGLKIDGKVEATSKTLKPENVCFDVTIPVDASSSDLLPVVFLTGYRINYVPGGSAVRLFSSSEDRRPGIAVCYHGNNAVLLNWNRQDGDIVTNFISQAFDPTGKKYQQLTPDGPLAP